MDPSKHNQHNLDLAQRCLLHLDREEAHLDATAEVLHRAHAAAVGGQKQGMAELLQSQATAAEAMRQERDAFRRQAGALLNIPAQEVTLQKLARHMPSDMARLLLERGSHMRGRFAEVERLGRDLALLSHYFLDFLQRFFIELTGGVKCGRYSPEGLRQEPACGSLLHAQG